MDPKQLLSWKAAAPLAAGTVALSLGISYYVGGPGRDAAPDSSRNDFKFARTGPLQAPGAPDVRAVTPGQGSYLDMFREANKNYAKETAPAAAPAAARQAPPKSLSRREKDDILKSLQEDLAAQAAGDPSADAGRSSAGGMYAARAGGGAEKDNSSAATAAGVSRLQAQQGSQARRGFGNAAFSSGSGAAIRRGADAPSFRAPGLSQGAGSATTGGEGALSQAGSGRYAGEYGSNGGGQHSSGDQSSSASGDNSAGMGAGAGKEKPYPLMYAWPKSFDFGTMDAYETASRQVIVMNMGTADLKVGQIENLDDGTPFTAQDDKCSNKVLAPRKSCTFSIRFAPTAANNYHTAMYVPSNSDDGYDSYSYLELKASSRYSSRGFMGLRGLYRGSGEGRVNAADFGMVPEGFPFTQALRVTNTSGETWDGVALDRSALPASFTVASDGCSGREVPPGSHCDLTLKLDPAAAVNRKFCSGPYGQYVAKNMYTNATVYSPRPQFPPLTLTGPVEASPEGQLKVTAAYPDDDYYARKRRHLVLTVPVKAKSCAQFPVYGLTSTGNFYYFK